MTTSRFQLMPIRRSSLPVKHFVNPLTSAYNRLTVSVIPKE